MNHFSNESLCPLNEICSCSLLLPGLSALVATETQAVGLFSYVFSTPYRIFCTGHMVNSQALLHPEENIVIA